MAVNNSYPILPSKSHRIALINWASLADERDSMMGIATFRSASDFFAWGMHFCANFITCNVGQ